MKETSKIAFGFLGIFLLSLLWYIFFYQVEKDKISSLKKEMAEVLFKIKSTAISEEEFLAVEEKLNKLREEVREKETKILPKSQITRIPDLIAQRGKQFDLKFVSIVPEFDTLFPVQTRKTEKSPLIKLPVTFRIRGRYQNFGRFLENLDQLPFILSVEEVELNYNPANYPQLDIQMKGVVFLRD